MVLVTSDTPNFEWLDKYVGPNLIQEKGSNMNEQVREIKKEIILPHCILFLFLLYIQIILVCILQLFFVEIVDVST